MKHILLTATASLAILFSSCEETVTDILDQNQIEDPRSETESETPTTTSTETSEEETVTPNEETEILTLEDINNQSEENQEDLDNNLGDFTGNERSTSQEETIDENGNTVTKGSVRNTTQVVNVNGEDVIAPEATNTDPNAIISDVLVNVNAYRATQGLTALILDDSVSAIAASHSENVAMGISGALEGFEEREATVTANFGSIIDYGENTAQNQTNGEGAVNQWLNTPRQRTEIENAAYTHTGIGSYQDAATGIIYYTQIYFGL